jgi:alkylation response protein AidB-like acyl-CoA dehydrogenase
MHFAFTDEQEQLRRGARRFLEAHAASARVRAVAASETGLDAEAWRRIATELGWPALVVPEAYGGAGLGMVELVAILEETGRVLLPTPFFATSALATSVLLACGDEAARAELLPPIAEGALTATLAWPGAVDVRGGKLYGRIAQVVDGATADRILVASGDGVHVVAGADAGLTRRALPTQDRTRRLAELTFEGVAARAIGGGLDVALAHANVALAAEQLGGAQRCLEMAVDYAKTRVQFGRAIGSFQAIKHKCADLFVAVESARSAVYWAAAVAAQGAPELPLAAATARATASEAFYKCAAENIQIHGGIGFTWEHDAHLFFRRARAGMTLLGDVAAQRERVATAILGAP